MSKLSTGSVAPKERINIIYQPATGNSKEAVELPLKVLVIGDFLKRTDQRSIDTREHENLTLNNFNDVMRRANLTLNFSVPNLLNKGAESDLNVQINPENLKDLEPDNLIQKIPELAKVYELRQSLLALKGPLGNSSSLRKTIMAMITDPDTRSKLVKEINHSNGTSVISDNSKEE